MGFLFKQSTVFQWAVQPRILILKFSSRMIFFQESYLILVLLSVPPLLSPDFRMIIMKFLINGVFLYDSLKNFYIETLHHMFRKLIVRNELFCGLSNAPM